ncbi:MAG: glycosyltransferase [Granulosicoccus sp.]|nr:glycosyltransferase [Granulosicoccus sp.]
MRISAIIPTWNRASTLERAVTSVLGQTKAVEEIIVVDDGSIDATQTVLDKFSTLKILHQQNAGVSAARNAGIRAAKGDWIALLDSDDEWLPEKIEEQCQALANDADSRVCHCDEIWIRKGVRVNPKHKHRKYGGWIYRHCLPLCAISPSAVLLRRDVFDTVGWFDESLPACEDYDYWLRLCASEPVTYIDKMLLKKYGGHDDQLSQRYWGMDRFRMAALAKVICSGTLNDEQLALTQDMLAQKLSIFVQGSRKRGHHDDAMLFENRFRPLTKLPLPDDNESISWHT